MEIKKIHYMYYKMKAEYKITKAVLTMTMLKLLKDSILFEVENEKQIVNYRVNIVKWLLD